MDQILCKNCGEAVDIDEAIRHQYEDKIRLEQEEKIKARVDKEKAEEIAAARKKALEEAEAEHKKDKEEKLELERKLKQSEEEGKKQEQLIKEQAKKDATEEFRLDKLAYEKRINDMQKSMDEAKRKGSQGSQQLQGDVLEIDLESKLKETFPNDEFKPVPTGIRGGDIVHTVRNRIGNEAGTILWEAKRQKAWNKLWLTKLKDDMRKIDATDCILVTDILPQNIRLYDRLENVWITSYEHALKLAFVVRFGILNVAIARSKASHSDEELKDLYRLITSDSFKNKFDARRETIKAMSEELESEKEAAQRRWSKRSILIESLARNHREIAGELEAHIPGLKLLSDGELLEPGIEDEDTKQALF